MSDEVFEEAKRADRVVLLRGVGYLLIALLALFASTFASMLGVHIVRAQGGELATWLIPAICACAFTWVLTRTSPRTTRLSRWMPAIFAWGVGLFLGIVIAGPALERARCGAYMIMEIATLRSVTTQHFEEVFAGDTTFRPLVVRLTEQKQPLPMFDPQCGKHRAKDIRIGQYTMSDLLKGRITTAQATDEVRSVLGDDPDWESYEAMGMCHDSKAWTPDVTMIVAWIVDVSDPEYPYILVGFSDNHAEAFKPSTLNDYLDLNDAIAARLGIDPAPPELRAWCKP